MGPAGATRDIAQYREKAAPGNLDFDGTRKLYLPSATFRPLFEHAPQRVLSALSQGFGQGAAEDLSPLLRCEIPTALSRPRMDVLAPVTRAIHCGKAVRLVYHSLSRPAGASANWSLSPWSIRRALARPCALDRKSAEDSGISCLPGSSRRWCSPTARSAPGKRRARCPVEPDRRARTAATCTPRTPAPTSSGATTTCPTGCCASGCGPPTPATCCGAGTSTARPTSACAARSTHSAGATRWCSTARPTRCWRRATGRRPPALATPALINYRVPANATTPASSR